MGLRRALLLCMAISAGLARFVLDGKHIFRGWWTWVAGSKTSNDKPCEVRRVGAFVCQMLQLSHTSRLQRLTLNFETPPATYSRIVLTKKHP